MSCAYLYKNAARTAQLLELKSKLEDEVKDLLAHFTVHGDDGICISDLIEPLMSVKGTIYDIEELM